jgi:hypothetical protein
MDAIRLQYIHAGVGLPPGICSVLQKIDIAGWEKWPNQRRLKPNARRANED